MKFDVLHEFRSHLEGKYGENTAKKYYFAVKGMLTDMQFDSVNQIKPEEIERRMSGLKTRNDFSAAKRGLLELQDCFPDLELPGSDFFTEASGSKRNYRKRSFEPLQLDSVKRKINAIQDRRLKLAYRLMLASGVRVSEAAELAFWDISFSENGIEVHVRNGKGGKSRVIGGIRDKYLERELPEFMADAKGSEDKLFYSASHMEHEATALGFECHDLRRAFAKAYITRQKQEASDICTAKGNLMIAMGHDNWRTTKRYLARKIVE